MCVCVRETFAWYRYIYIYAVKSHQVPRGIADSFCLPPSAANSWKSSLAAAALKADLPLTTVNRSDSDVRAVGLITLIRGKTACQQRRTGRLSVRPFVPTSGNTPLQNHGVKITMDDGDERQSAPEWTSRLCEWKIPPEIKKNIYIYQKGKREGRGKGRSAFSELRVPVYGWTIFCEQTMSWHQLVSRECR